MRGRGPGGPGALLAITALLVLLAVALPLGASSDAATAALHTNADDSKGTGAPANKFKERRPHKDEEGAK